MLVGSTGAGEGVAVAGGCKVWKERRSQIVSLLKSALDAYLGEELSPDGLDV